MKDKLEDMLQSPLSKSIGTFAAVEGALTYLFPDGTENLLQNSIASLIVGGITYYKEKQKDWYKSIIEHSPDGIVVTDTQGVIQYVNPHFEELTGYSKEEAIGNTPKILSSGYTSDATFEEMFKTIKKGYRWRGTIINKKKNGELYYDEQTTYPVKDKRGNNTKYVSIKRDITSQKQLEEELKIEAIHDDMTGVLNNSAFIEEVREYFLRTSHNNECAGILYLDFDGFKKINDEFMHETGDKVLKEGSYRIKQSVREEDLVGRMGGDEFAILLKNIETEKDIVSATSHIIEALGKPIPIENDELCHIHYIGASIGAYFYNPMLERNDIPTEDLVETIVNKADSAMYKSKKTRESKLTLYPAQGKETYEDGELRMDTVSLIRNVKEQRKNYPQPSFAPKTISNTNNKKVNYIRDRS